MSSDSQRPVLFFDIDNCLYPRSYRIQDHMQSLIDSYFEHHLSLSPDDATLLHKRYYTDYGLALAGLVKHHKIDPLAYNAEVDDALPLDGIIKKDDGLRRLLQSFDRSKVKLWLFTNGYVTHAKRVVRLLGVEDQFEGITFCDYSRVPLVAKPHDEIFDKAERQAGAPSGGGGCYFVDDSRLNCTAARARGWEVVWKVEEGDNPPEGEKELRWVKKLQDLKNIWPGFFKAPDAEVANGSV